MGLTKIDQFTKKQLRTAELLKAMAHPARIAILELMIAKQKCICGQLVDELPLAQSTVSQHLKELKNAGLIKGDIEGTSTCYCINAKSWKEAQDLFNGLFERYNKQIQCC